MNYIMILAYSHLLSHQYINRKKCIRADLPGNRDES